MSLHKYLPDPSTKSLDALVVDIDRGMTKIPQFQRDFVWAKQKSADLLDSILKGYPIGTFIYWETKEELRSVRNIGGLELPDTPKGKFVQYVLDGQQRLTSLYAAVKGAKIDRDGEEEDFSEFWVDLEAGADEPIVVPDREDGRDPNGAHSNILAHRLLFGMLNGVGIKKCIDLKDFVRNTPNTRYLDIFYSNPINPNLPRALTTPVTRARAATAALDAWTMADDLSTRANDIGGLIDHVLGAGKRADWDAFAATLPGGMLLEELAEYFSASDLARQQLLLVVQARLNPQGATPNTPVAPPNAVRVMTMHGAKGLDAKVVFIPGLEQGMIPSARAVGFPAQIEEAARLLFVSFTRARAGLIMSRSDYRTVNGRRESTTLSQFCTHTGGGFGRRTGGLSTTESAYLAQVATTMADLLAGRI